MSVLKDAVASMFLSFILCEWLINMHLFLYKYVQYNNNLFIQIVFIIQCYQDITH